jgi:hypothetical protein
MLPLLLNTAATGMLIGLGFTIQLVHYPLFARVGREAWPAYAAAHGRRITLLVGPWMLLEALTGAWLLWRPPPGLSSALLWWAGLVVAVIWLLSALVNGPAFQRLASAWSPAGHRALVLANWPRTIAWTARGVLLLVLLRQAWSLPAGP